MVGKSSDLGHSIGTGYLGAIKLQVNRHLVIQVAQELLDQQIDLGRIRDLELRPFPALQNLLVLHVIQGVLDDRDRIGLRVLHHASVLELEAKELVGDLEEALHVEALVRQVLQRDGGQIVRLVEVAKRRGEVPDLARQKVELVGVKFQRLVQRMQRAAHGVADHVAGVEDHLLHARQVEVVLELGALLLQKARELHGGLDLTAEDLKPDGVDEARHQEMVQDHVLVEQHLDARVSADDVKHLTQFLALDEVDLLVADEHVERRAQGIVELSLGQ